MTCSSNTTSTPEPVRWRLALAAMALALAAPGFAAQRANVAELIAKAGEDLKRGDGIAAEVRLKQALAAGAKREDVAARMGEAYLHQDQPGKAREWLGPAAFSRADAALGFRMLARLERLEGNLPAAGRAFDRAIAIDDKDPLLWVEVGRLRYAGGEHMLAIEAADYALELDPASPRALEFRGQFVRDEFGFAAALPWFEAGLAKSPNDLALLGERAATLGELGRASDMLEVTRRMRELSPRHPRALYLEAVLALRAGDAGTARSLLNRAGDRLEGVPAVLLLDGAIALQQGNYRLAVAALEPLTARQPANIQAQELLARAYYLSRRHKDLIARFSSLASQSDASPYLLTLVARAHEALGQRDAAAPLLDRARRTADRPFAPVFANAIGAMINDGNRGGAAAEAERRRGANPGSAQTQSLAGDAQYALGRNAEAVDRYRLAARVRMPESLLQRLAAALTDAGRGEEAAVLAENHLGQSPSSRVAARLAAGYAAQGGDWPRARLLLEHLRDNGGASDARLLADLSLAQLRDGDEEAAEATARRAYELQPANPAAALVWGMVLAAREERPATARALLDKARTLGGDPELIAEARRML